jgi:hypothetical protein
MVTKQTAAIDMSVDEVAQALGTTPVNVLLFIKRGLLVGHEDENGWLVDGESFATFRNSEAGQAGRAHCRSACSRAGGCGSCE